MIRFYGSAQQTIMGQYMEQNVKAFLAIQKKLQDQAKQVYGDKMLLTPDLWKQFMQMQAPAMQGMLGNYLEQSAKLFMDMQQRMQDQTRGMFTAFPFPNFGAPPQTGAEDDSQALSRRKRAQHRAIAAPRCCNARSDVPIGSLMPPSWPCHLCLPIPPETALRCRTAPQVGSSRSAVRRRSSTPSRS